MNTVTVYPFIDSLKTIKLKETLVKHIKDLKFYEKIETHAENIAEKMAAQTSDRAYRMIKMKPGKRLYVSAIGILAPIVAPFSDYVAKCYLKKELKKSIKKGILCQKLTPITIRIKHDKKKIRLSAVHSSERETKIKPFRDSSYSYFNLYILKKENPDTSKKEPIIEFYARPEVKIQNIDPNLINQNRFSSVYKIDGLMYRYKFSFQEISLPIDACLDENSSIFHSLKILEYHIAPILTLDIDTDNPQFHFLENTMPMSERFE